MDLQSGLPLLLQQSQALVAPPIPPWEDKFYIYKPCFDFVWSGNASARVRSIAGRLIPSTKTNSTPVVKQGQFEDPTIKFQIPLQIAAEREMARSLIGVPNFSWIVALKEFAHPPEDIPSVFQIVGVTFVATSMFCFVFQMSSLITEKELKLRQAITMMGLYDCILVFMAHMGGNYYTSLITFHYSVWNDISV